MSRVGNAIPGNVKVIAAWTALVVALSGAVEARVTLGTIEHRVDRIERMLDQETFQHAAN